MGLCTANTPLRDSSLLAKEALETVASDPVLATAATASAAAVDGEVAAVAAAVSAVAGTRAVSATRDDDDDTSAAAAASAAAMLLKPKTVCIWSRALMTQQKMRPTYLLSQTS